MYIHKIIVFITCFIFSTFLFAQQKNIIKDFLGREIEFNTEIKRAISISPEATETIFAINAGSKLVADTTYCDFPLAAKNLPKVGGFSANTISIEAIVKNKPDIVITAGSYHESVEIALAPFKIKCFAYAPNNFLTIQEGIKKLGLIFNKERDANFLAAKLKSELEKISKLTDKLGSKDRPRVFWLVYDNPLMTSGKNTFQNQLIEIAGGFNIFSDIESQWMTVNSEEVLKRNPDFIIENTDMVETANLEVLKNFPGWANISAIKKANVGLIDGDISTRAGPRIYEAALQLLNILHKELKP